MSQILSYLPLLACPAGMGLMMLMMRGGSSHRHRTADDPRITRLEREIEVLRAEARERERPVDRAS